MSARVAIVIPVHNERERLVGAVESISEHNNVSVKFYIVDDASTDGTGEVIEKYFQDKQLPYEIIANKHPEGAGGSRNSGFKRVVEDYTLFFDADDFVFPGMLDKVVQLADQDSSQVVVMGYDRVYAENDRKLGMNHHDEKVFERVQHENKLSPFSIKKSGFLLDLVNYPWNKLVSTEYAKDIGLHFSSTPVHNDVFAHWQILMNCSRLSVTSESFCGHRVSFNEGQITNISDSRRLAMLNVFSELEDYFDQNDELKPLFYHYFISFKIRLFRWGSAKIDDGHKEEFYNAFCDSFHRMKKLDFVALSEKMPRVSVEALRYRLRLR
ncbi:glycosyltransferase family 2 protein [Halomonas borealis]|uniref:glycosyltransferase family 2 protein n=1 Tax=Halomonas borealis TaxID=2508710 RepID=UPI0010A05FA7|nr:glycosyltransferase family 2 protein [Halomonas borealis]